MTAPTADDAAAARWPDLVLVIALSLLAGLAALVALAFLPLYAGSVPLPVGILIAAGAMAWFPRACGGLTHRWQAAAAPVVVWFAVTMVVLLVGNPMYSGAPIVGQDWRVLLLLGAGVVVGALMVAGTSAVPHLAAPRPPSDAGPRAGTRDT